MSAIAIPAATPNQYRLVAHRDGEYWPFELDIVNLADCYSDRYQRPLDERWLRGHSGERFRPEMLGTITVSDRERRNKHFAVIDGQHRVELCRREDYPIIPAVVFTGLTIETEARLFSDYQRERRKVTAIQQFNSDLVAKKPEALAIDRIIHEIGLKVAEGKDGPGFIKCISALQQVYDSDPAMLRTVLSIIQRAYRDAPGARSEAFVRGVWRFAREEQDLDPDRFVERVGQFMPSYLITKAHQLRDGNDSGGTLPQFLAEAISNAYRRRSRR